MSLADALNLSGTNRRAGRAQLGGRFRFNPYKSRDASQFDVQSMSPHNPAARRRGVTPPDAIQRVLRNPFLWANHAFRFRLIAQLGG
jgi:hypothetical protein